jgi:hypothetical protein
LNILGVWGDFVSLDARTILFNCLNNVVLTIFNSFSIKVDMKISKDDRIKELEEQLKNAQNTNPTMAGLVLWSDNPNQIEVQIGITKEQASNLEFHNGVGSMVARMRKSNGKPEGAMSAYYAAESYVNTYDQHKEKQEQAGYNATPMLRIMQA